MLCIDIFLMVLLFKSLWYVMFWYFLNGAFIWKFVVCYVLIFFEWCVYLEICGMLCFDIFEWCVYLKICGMLCFEIFWIVHLFEICGMLCIDIFWMVRLFGNLWYGMFWYFLNGAFIWKFVVCYVLIFLNVAFIWTFVVCYALIFFEWCVYLNICGMLCILNGAFIWKFVVCYVLMFFEWYRFFKDLRHALIKLHMLLYKVLLLK